MVKHFPSICEALGLIKSTTKGKKLFSIKVEKKNSDKLLFKFPSTAVDGTNEKSQGNSNKLSFLKIETFFS